MANALTEVQNTFLSLDSQYNMLRAACKTDQDRTNLAAMYADAQKNYQTCVNKILEDDDAQVAALCKALKAANSVVDQATKEMGEMNKVIDGLTTAIDLGSKLIACL
jgi:uncharacterized protein (UPF0264 family)